MGSDYVHMSHCASRQTLLTPFYCTILLREGVLKLEEMVVLQEKILFHDVCSLFIVVGNIFNQIYL